MSALRGGPHWAWTTARCPQENPWAMQRWDERGGSASRSSGQTEPQRERSDSGLPVFLGKRDECLICKVPCRTILLSKHTDSDIRALFLGIDGLCRKYSMETSQVSEFQEKHRRRLLAFYGEKISSLEESLRKSALQLEQLQSVRLAQQTAFGTIKTPVSTPTAKPSGPVFLPPDSSASQSRVESMEVDLAPSPRRKPEATAGPARISVISPPRDGRMGSVAHHPQHLSLTPCRSSEPQAPRIPALRLPCEGWTGSQAPPAASGAGRGVAPRPPISIAGLLQRQHLSKCCFEK
ncbi:probable E3 SUMO-protein ligase RNF212 isoform X5 [Vicugna pacos]|uniref:Probable E3 SUMO-protein ligase RNF212 isoform X5 n=1 Tax=Vicugna pacos TaxID=30538 RepID=A0ABM5C4Q9_VICPA